MPGSKRHRDRLIMGRGAILSVQSAVGLLPVADAIARSWLVERGLVGYLAGRRVVVWAEVMDALRAGDTPVPKPRAGVPLARVKL